MPLSMARIPTPNALRYLIQLTKHFAHKIPTWQAGNEGDLNFPMGGCALRASDGVLTLTAAAADTEALGQTREVVERHLRRFAFREEMGTLPWVDVTAEEAAQAGGGEGSEPATLRGGPATMETARVLS